jgi:hypothetical protein
MKLIIQRPALPLLLLGIILDLPVSRVRPKPAYDPRRAENEGDAGEAVSESGGSLSIDSSAPV